jgi:glycosyltransferase involved in cell wall biosynthesis
MKATLSMAHAERDSPSALIATFTYPPDVNGVAEASRKCAQALLEAGWKVDIATTRSRTKRDEQPKGGAVVHEFDLNSGLSGCGMSTAAVASYKDFLTKGSWDVIIFQGYQWPLQLAETLLPSLACKKVLVSHGYAALRWFPVSRFPFGIGQWARSACKSIWMTKWAHYIDRWVFLSRQHDFDAFFDHTIARLIGHKGIRIIPNGVQLPDKTATSYSFRNDLGIPKEAFVFLNVGYYSRGKDQGFAVKAFRKANIPDSVLVFIGTEFNEWSERFQNIDDNLSVASKGGRIVWLDKQTRHTTLAAFNESDAFVLSSKLETQPICILEAMSFGKPWIARKAGCIASLPGGICVNSGNSMAKAMRRISSDSQLRSHLARRGSEAAARLFNLRKNAETFEDMLSDTLGEASRSTQA